MTDADSIWDYCINGLDHQLPENDDPAMKYPCAVCDQLGHTFENYPFFWLLI